MKEKRNGKTRDLQIFLLEFSFLFFLSSSEGHQVRHNHKMTKEKTMWSSSMLKAFDHIHLSSLFVSYVGNAWPSLLSCVGRGFKPKRSRFRPTFRKKRENQLREGNLDRANICVLMIFDHYVRTRLLGDFSSEELGFRVPADLWSALHDVILLF